MSDGHEIDFTEAVPLAAITPEAQERAKRAAITGARCSRRWATS